MKAKTRLVLLFGVPLLVLAVLVAKHVADSAALASTGFREDAGASVQESFTACIRSGAVPAQVARCMPAGASVDRFVAPTSDGDSVLLERYTYHAWGVGRWPVQIYYIRGGGVFDFYAQDEWPSLSGTRSIGAAEAERWQLN